MVEYIRLPFAHQSIGFGKIMLAYRLLSALFVPDIYIVIHYNQEFIEHHLSGSPQRIGYLKGLTIVTLVYFYNSEIVTHTLFRQV